MPRSPFADVDKNEPTGAGRAAVLQMIEDACNLSYNVDGVTANDFAFKGKDGKPITHRTPLDKILPEVNNLQRCLQDPAHNGAPTSCILCFRYVCVSCGSFKSVHLL